MSDNSQDHQDEADEGIPPLKLETKQLELLYRTILEILREVDSRPPENDSPISDEDS